MARQLLVLLGLAACGGERTTAAPAAPRARTDVAMRQQRVLEGLPESFEDECYAGPAWASVDDARAGAKLDAILSKLSTGERTSRESVCMETLAVARMLRLARVGQLDIAAELDHPVPIARVVAARAAQTHGKNDPRVGPALRAHLDDADASLRIEAHDAVRARHDRDAVPALRAIADRRDARRPLACATLIALDAAGDCTPAPENDEPFATLTGSGPRRDFCAESMQEVRSNDPGKQALGLLFYMSDEFERTAQPYFGFPDGHGAMCTPPADYRRLLESPRPLLRALAAATALWQARAEL